MAGVGRSVGIGIIVPLTLPGGKRPPVSTSQARERVRAAYADAVRERYRSYAIHVGASERHRAVPSWRTFAGTGPIAIPRHPPPAHLPAVGPPNAYEKRNRFPSGAHTP